jgi:hypothetical protein
MQEDTRDTAPRQILMAMIPGGYPGLDTHFYFYFSLPFENKVRKYGGFEGMRSDRKARQVGKVTKLCKGDF